MKTARHVDSTNPERVRVMLATGRALHVARRADRHHRLPAELRETVAWWTRVHYRLLRGYGVDRTTARSIVRVYAHMASMGMRWPHENGRAGEQTPNPTNSPEEPEAAPNVTERGR